MTGARPTFVVGDIHGELEKLSELLQTVELIDSQRRWRGNTAALWFTGDFFDRGPDGIGVIELIMRLQVEAAAVDGEVGALLGNHEPLLLAAHRFGNRKNNWGYGFHNHWQRAGGQLSDIKRLDTRHIEWLTHLPVMALVADRLLIHADATLYAKYGATIDEVNQTVAAILQGDDITAWDILLDRFAERMVFASLQPDDIDPASQFLARQTLQQFGGSQIIHGHTPIFMIKQVPPATIREPWVYAGGLCVNIDGAMCVGGPGFVHQLSPIDQELTPLRRYSRRPPR